MEEVEEVVFELVVLVATDVTGSMLPGGPGKAASVLPLVAGRLLGYCKLPRS